MALAGRTGWYLLSGCYIVADPVDAGWLLRALKNVDLNLI